MRRRDNLDAKETLKARRVAGLRGSKILEEYQAIDPRCRFQIDFPRPFNLGDPPDRGIQLYKKLRTSGRGGIPEDRQKASKLTIPARRDTPCLCATRKLSRAPIRQAPRFYGSYGNAERLRSFVKAASDCSLARQKGKNHDTAHRIRGGGYSMAHRTRYNASSRPPTHPRTWSPRIRGSRCADPRQIRGTGRKTCRREGMSRVSLLQTLLTELLGSREAGISFTIPFNFFHQRSLDLPVLSLNVDLSVKKWGKVIQQRREDEKGVPKRGSVMGM